MAGFVYIFTNPAYGHLIKIGKSDRDPEAFRRTELDGTGVPEPFKVEYYAYVDDHHSLERLLHQRFADARPNKHREFFAVSVFEAIQAIQNAGPVRYEQNNYREWREKVEAERQARARLEREQQQRNEALRRERDRIEHEERVRQESLRQERAKIEREREQAEVQRQRAAEANRLIDGLRDSFVSRSLWHYDVFANYFERPLQAITLILIVLSVTSLSWSTLAFWIFVGSLLAYAPVAKAERKRKLQQDAEEKYPYHTPETFFEHSSQKIASDNSTTSASPPTNSKANLGRVVRPDIGLPVSGTRQISRACIKCSTTFSVTVARGEQSTHCPSCFSLISLEQS